MPDNHRIFDTKVVQQAHHLVSNRRHATIDGVRGTETGASMASSCGSVKEANWQPSFAAAVETMQENDCCHPLLPTDALQEKDVATPLSSFRKMDWVGSALIKGRISHC